MYYMVNHTQTNYICMPFSKFQDGRPKWPSWPVSRSVTDDAYTWWWTSSA